MGYIKIEEESMSYKYKLLSTLWFGIFLMFLSGAVAQGMNLLVGAQAIISPVQLAVVVAFAAGIGFTIMSSWELLFGYMGEPSFVYRPDYKYVFVRFNSNTIEIEKDDTKLGLQMVQDMPYTSRRLWITESGERFWAMGDSISGSKDSNILTTSNGHVLHFTRHMTGIKVWWEEENSPWKIVERK